MKTQKRINLATLLLYFNPNLLRFQLITDVKSMCSFEKIKARSFSAVFGLWELFLTANTRVIVAESHSHQPFITI